MRLGRIYLAGFGWGTAKHLFTSARLKVEDNVSRYMVRLFAALAKLITQPSEGYLRNKKIPVAVVMVKQK